MATFTITIPDTVVQRVLDAVASAKGYNPGIDGTKVQFVKTVIMNYIKTIVVDQEGAAAAAAALASARATSNSDIQIT